MSCTVAKCEDADRFQDSSRWGCYSWFVSAAGGLAGELDWAGGGQEKDGQKLLGEYTWASRGDSLWQETLPTPPKYPSCYLLLSERFNTIAKPLATVTSEEV